MMIKDAETFQIKSHFNNFESFAQLVQGLGLDFQQLDCGQFQAYLHQIAFPDILISEARFNRILRQRGTLPEGMRTFVIMTTGGTPFVWQNQKVTQNSIVVFPQEADLDAASLAGFHVYTLSVSERVIAARLREEVQPKLCARLKKGGVLEVNPEKIQGLRYFMESLSAETDYNPKLLGQHDFQKRIRWELTDHIFGILRVGEESRPTMPFQKHTRLIENIETWLSETGYEHHSINELCRVFQVNERTLRRIFSARYGVSPKQYLLAMRLNGARKWLCRSDPLTTRVSDIANDWGFWHIGKFAGFYRRQFGELPSETLNCLF